MVLIHASEKKLQHFANIKQVTYYKPRGIWYASDDSWVKTTHNKKYKYFYRIEVFYTTLVSESDKKSVLHIGRDDKCLELIYKYGYVNPKGKGGMLLLDWVKIGKDYGGIEFESPLKYLDNHLFKDSKLVAEFKLHGLNVTTNTLNGIWCENYDQKTSGCVWNRSAIRSFFAIDRYEVDLVGKYDEHYLQLIRRRKKGQTHKIIDK